jgi:hypothetical protein
MLKIGTRNLLMKVDSENVTNGTQENNKTKSDEEEQKFERIIWCRHQNHKIKNNFA